MIYIVRHGQTVWNLDKRKQGNKDSPLTIKGFNQAKEISELLSEDIKNFKYYRLVVSPQWRCQQFASIVCELNGLNFKDCILENHLREHCFGLWEGLTEEEIEAEFPNYLKNRYKPENYWNYIVPMGESYELLSKRVKPIVDKYKNKDTIFICHEMVSKTIRGHLLNLKPEQILSLNHPQNTVYKFVNNILKELKTNVNY